MKPLKFVICFVGCIVLTTLMWSAIAALLPPWVPLPLVYVGGLLVGWYSVDVANYLYFWWTET